MDTDIQSYAEAMPQYQEQLNALGRVLDFQASLVQKIEPGLPIEPDVAHQKWRTGHPLFPAGSLPIPPSLFQAAVTGLHAALPPGGAAQASLDRLLASSSTTASNVGALLEEYLEGDNPVDDEGNAQSVDGVTSTDPEVLTLVLRTLLYPFFEKRVAPYREWVETDLWRRGTCPMCGSEPHMARLASDDGQRILACSLCRTEWSFDRLRCPFCESDAQYRHFDDAQYRPQLRHFTIDGDEARRVDCCDQCQRYIKTVDERVSGRPANLLAEDVITAHLDVLARDHGYR